MISAQIQLIKADMLAKMAAGQPLAGLQEPAIAAYYNTVTVNDIWRTDAPVDAIMDAITWDRYTPTDAVDATALFANRAAVIRIKQANLLGMLAKANSLNMAKANIRAGLRDAVVAIPAGALGANVSPGGVNGATVLAACVRKATNAEMVLSTAAVTTGNTTARVPSYEESGIYITGQLVSDIQTGQVN